MKVLWFWSFVLFSTLPVTCFFAEAQQTGGTSDCTTLSYKPHRSAWLCGKAIVCSGDICGRPSTYDFDDAFDVILRNKRGKELETKSLTYQKPTFCFDGREDGDYQFAFVLYKQGYPEPARVFPTRYKRNAKKPNDRTYMIEAKCPREQQ